MSEILLHGLIAFSEVVVYTNWNTVPSGCPMKSTKPDAGIVSVGLPLSTWVQPPVEVPLLLTTSNKYIHIERFGYWSKIDNWR